MTPAVQNIVDRLRAERESELTELRIKVAALRVLEAKASASTRYLTRCQDV